MNFNPTRKRVIFLVGSAPSVASFRRPLISLLKEKKIPQEWYLADNHAASEALLAEHGLEPRFFGLDRGSASPVKDLPAIWNVFQIMRKADDAVIVVYTLKLILYVGVLAWILRPFGFRRRVVLAGFMPGLGYSLNPGPNASLQRRILNQIVRLTCWISFGPYDRMVFTNTDNMDMIDDLSRSMRRKVKSVVPGAGVDLARFPEKPLPPSADKVRFIYVGRLNHDKGVGELIAAAEMLQASHPDQFEVVVYGSIDPSNRTKIDDATFQKANAHSFMNFAGSTSDVPSAIAGAHVGVLPSYHEGRPTVVMEWMAIGRAGITTTAPGCRETVKHGESGYLIPPGDAGALHGAMAKYLDDRDLITAHGKAAAETARAEFGLETVLPNTIRGLGIIEG